MLTFSKGAHAVLGVIALAWVVFQAALGVYTKLHWDKQFRSTAAIPEPRVFPDKIHWFSGYALPVIGLVNVFLGLYDWGVNTLWMLLWGIYCALVLIAFLLLEIRKTRKDRRAEQEISQYYEKGAVPLSKSGPQPKGHASGDIVIPPVVAIPAQPNPQPVPFPELGDSISDETQTRERPFSASIPPPPAFISKIPEEEEESSSSDPDEYINAAAANTTVTMGTTTASGTRETEETRLELIAKETDGELVSTEEAGSASVTSTPRTHSPSNASPRSSNMGSVTANELAELEAISANAKKELLEMQAQLKKYE